jgi:hypothetical protein
MSAGGTNSGGQSGYLNELDDGMADAVDNLASSTSSSLAIANEVDDGDTIAPLTDAFRTHQKHIVPNKAKMGSRYVERCRPAPRCFSLATLADAPPAGDTALAGPCNVGIPMAAIADAMVRIPLLSKSAPTPCSTVRGFFFFFFFFFFLLFPFKSRR